MLLSPQTFLHGILLLITLAVGSASAQNTSNNGNDVGRTHYQSYCANCHDHPEQSKAPSFDALRQMSPRAVSYALTNGKMRIHAQSLSAPEIDQLVSYLATTVAVDDAWVRRFACNDGEHLPTKNAVATISGFGIGNNNHRYLSTTDTGLAKKDFSQLELAWALAFPQTATMRSQPVVVDSTMYLAVVDSGQLFAFDIGSNTPCVHWVYQHKVPLRSSLQWGRLDDGSAVLVFGDNAAHVQMLNATTGELLWRTSVRISSVSNTTGMPVLFQGRVYAPISSGELNMGAAADYECCTSHGGVVAIDANSGDVVWTYRTMPPATPRKKNKLGTQLWGPSGAPIWTTPAIDEKRGVLYVGSGENTSEPATDTSDAVLALDLNDGSLRWKFQATANDIFLTGCMFEPQGPNCPPAYSVNADWDFGASIIIAKRTDGSDILLAGQKSGTLWALDPDHNGKLLWRTDVGPGGPAGGIHWGMAVADQRVFAAINRVGIPREDPDGEPGLHAIDINNGNILWSYRNKPDCSATRKKHIHSCDTNFGMSSATLVIDGAVVQGTNDGFLKVFDGDNGELLFSYDIAREFNTLNGVAGHGGSIDNASIVAANGLLLVQSGYGLLGVPGNILLAFKQK